jgi:hypothetical protein
MAWIFATAVVLGAAFVAGCWLVSRAIVKWAEWMFRSWR